MSLQLSDTSTYRGIAQIYEKECGFSRGYITGDTDRLKEFVADVNLAMDDLQNIAVKTAGGWQPGDSNHTKYSILFMDIVSGQADYPFTVDEQGNLITDVYRIAVAGPDGIYKEVKPVDQQLRNLNNRNTDNFLSGSSITGVPTEVDKTDNAFFFKPTPNYSLADGIKFLANREASYFTYEDTSKKPGVPGDLHRWFAIKPACDYARRNTLKTYPALFTEVEEFKKKIAETYATRERDVVRRLSANVENNK